MIKKVVGGAVSELPVFLHKEFSQSPATYKEAINRIVLRIGDVEKNIATARHLIIKLPDKSERASADRILADTLERLKRNEASILYTYKPSR